MATAILFSKKIIQGILLKLNGLLQKIPTLPFLSGKIGILIIKNSKILSYGF